MEISEEDKEAIRQASSEFHSSMEQAMAEAAETESEVTAYLSPAEPAQKLTGPVDQSDPYTLAQEMVIAGKAGQYAMLAPLCDPIGRGDRDSQTYICDLAAQSDE